MFSLSRALRIAVLDSQAKKLIFDFARPVLPAGALLTRSSIGTRFNAAGAFATEAIDVPRFDHVPGSPAYIGLLIETQRTNYLLNTNTYSDASWTKLRGSISTPGDTFGGITAAKYTSDGTTGEHGIAHGSVTLSGGSVRTWSAIVKKSGWRYVIMRTNAVANTYRNVVFDLDTGLVTYAGTGYTGVMVALGDGWYRIEARFTADNTATFLILDFNSTAVTSDSGVSCAGDSASGGWLAHMQFEAGTTYSSIIRTDGSLATRNAEVLTLNNLNLSNGIYQAIATGALGTYLRPLSVTAGIATFTWPASAIGEWHLRRIEFR